MVDYGWSVRRLSSNVARRLSSHSIGRPPSVGEPPSMACPSPFLSSLESQHHALLVRGQSEGLIPEPAEQRQCSYFDREPLPNVDREAIRQNMQCAQYYSNDAFGLEVVTSSDSEDDAPHSSSTKENDAAPAPKDFRRLSWDEDAIDLEAVNNKRPDNPPSHISSAKIRQQLTGDKALFGPYKPKYSISNDSDASRSQSSSSISSDPSDNPSSIGNSSQAFLSTLTSDSLSNESCSDHRVQQGVPQKMKNKAALATLGDHKMFVEDQDDYPTRLSINESCASLRRAPLRGSDSLDKRTSLVPIERLFPHLANVVYKDSRNVDLFIFLHNGMRAELRDLHKMVDAIRCRMDQPRAIDALRLDARSLASWWSDAEQVFGTALNAAEHFIFPYIQGLVCLSSGLLSETARYIRQIEIRRYGVEVSSLLRQLGNTAQSYSTTGYQSTKGQMLANFASLLRNMNSYSSCLIAYMELIEREIPALAIDSLTVSCKHRVEADVRHWILRGSASGGSGRSKVKKPMIILAALLRWTDDYSVLSTQWNVEYMRGKATRFLYNNVWRRALQSVHLRHVDIVSRP